MESRNLKNQLYKDRFIIMFIFIVNVVLHGKHAFTLNYLFDTDDALYTRLTTLNWLEIGRQGAVLTKRLFGTLWYNPYLTGIIGILFFSLWQYLIICLLRKAGKKQNNTSLYVFAAVLSASPVWAYQFYFSLQWIEVTWAMLLLVFVELLCYNMFEKEKWYHAGVFKKAVFFIAEVILLVWAFCTYQALVGMFIAICASLYLLSITEIYIDKDNFRDYFLRGVWLAAIFGTAFLINNIITNLYFSTSDYLMAQNVWGTWDTSEIIRQLNMYFKYSYSGKEIHYSWMMGFGTAGVLIIFMGVLFSKKFNHAYKALYSISVLITITSVHFLNIYCGRATAIRSQIVYPYIMAFLVFYMFYFVCNIKNKCLNALKYILVFALFIGAFRQAGNTLRLYYTDDVKCRVDMEIMDDVVDEIHKLGLGYMPKNQVVFLGNLHPKLNESCYDINPSEYSFFDWSLGVSCWRRVNEQPARLVRMINSHLGFRYVQADWTTIEHAGEISMDMPCYPDDGFVQLKEDLIIVKMGNYYK